LGSDLESLTDEEQEEQRVLSTPPPASTSGAGELAATTAGSGAEPDPAFVAEVVEQLDALYADPEKALAEERQALAEVAEGADVSSDAVDFAWLLATYLEATDSQQRAQSPEQQAATPQPGDGDAGDSSEGRGWQALERLAR
jgi:hypothetical protein